MRLGGRLSGAIDILADIETRRRPVADALKDWGLSHRFAGSGDRAAIGNIVYDALRMKLSHAFLLDDDSPAALAYGVLLRQWGYTPEALAAALEGDSFAPEPLGEARLAAFSSRSLADAPLFVQGDVPDWVEPSLEAAFGAGWLKEAQALCERPSLDLRANTLKSTRDKVIKALERSGAEPAPIAPNGIRIAPGEGPSRLPNVTAELAFQKGWFEVQDEGSQLVADLVEAGEGEQVLDFCAGGGGKTLAMAAAMNNKGQVHAFDADRKRLAPIIERLKRAGTHNVQVHDRPEALQKLEGRMDKVLVDAPCTGTGTWRRRPDTKWRLTPRNLQERIDQQAEALADAARHVRPGGELIYVTCSILPEENQNQIAAFVARHPEFSAVPLMPRWQARFGTAHKPVESETGGLTLSPGLTGTDGFFCARLQRAL
ncbi:RsmB/NOP family class I SAM-dependent RNA methyltransferase [Rhizobium paknamense]|uniref:16S rRNA (Cytosine967-C5)-methyltransferase n=1 Tax=Rhizobium paknamense TaxID=1206817 RepID=A0ABU0IAW6_9HYPH|nr:RsmB/NOP family class I SAM-dependent RNA methyltransferase [Rhizobium paknamense]MDQ0455350.1 16S rRNA (cytosine967-C5)-methyltransferase [Rhizobium paknamense]